MNENKIIPTVNEIFGVDVESRSRRKTTTLARALAYCVFREIGYTYKNIGLIFDRDHSEIMRRVRRYKNDPRLIKIRAMI